MDIALYDYEDRLINIDYSNIDLINGQKHLYVYFSRNRDNHLDTAVCEYPALSWHDIRGFSENDMELLREFMECHLPIPEEVDQQVASDEEVMRASNTLLKENRAVYEKLAK